MAKPRTAHVCQACGYRNPKWLGRCPQCGEYNTLVEEVETPEPVHTRARISEDAPVPITEVRASDRPRFPTGIGELDRVLGGGIVPGSVCLVGGDPGIGKSTLILQMCDRLARAGRRVLYVSAEESVLQTKMRADRLGVGSPNLYVLCETNLEAILRHAGDLKPAAVVVDSIQMVYRSSLPSAPGTVGQVRECTGELVTTAKREALSVFVVGHVTKEGMIAGPRTLEHMVDAVFYFEGDRYQAYRILRSVKNRFGSTFEVGIFEMRSDGLAEVPNPSQLFLSSERTPRPGCAVSASVVGSRTLLVEVQALTQTFQSGRPPMRRVSGVDSDRVAMVSAVLERRFGLPMGLADVFVNAVGGVQLAEPAADLAIAASVASSMRNRALSEGSVVVGEVGLTGEVRGVTQAEMRVAEAARLGFRRVVLPRDNAQGVGKPEGVELSPVGTLAEALEELEVV